jgi:hypothetical protein
MSAETTNLPSIDDATCSKYPQPDAGSESITVRRARKCLIDACITELGKEMEKDCTER